MTWTLEAFPTYHLAMPGQATGILGLVMVVNQDSFNSDPHPTSFLLWFLPALDFQVLWNV